MRSDRAAGAKLLALVVAPLLASCGLANGVAGVRHLLYADDVAFCRHCASSGEVCADKDDGSFDCVATGELAGCGAAQALFFEQEEGGPFLSPARGSAGLDEGFRSDCEGGRNPYVADLVIVDLEYDTPFDSDWSEADGDEAVGDAAILTDESGGVFKPASWRAQSAYSNDATDVSYLTEVLYCISQVLDGELALQVTDSPGHHSNAICLAAPSSSSP